MEFLAIVSAALAIWALVRAARRPFAFADGHPRCRKCRFDLFGKPADSHHCPECGSELWRGGVITGIQRWKSAVLALIFLIASLAFFDASYMGIPLRYRFYNFSRDYDAFVLRHTSTAQLMQAAPSSPIREDAEYRELSSRIRTGGMTDEQVHQVMLRAIKTPSGIPVFWPNFAAVAHEAGKVSASDWKQFITSQANATVEIRPRMRQGDPLPISCYWRTFPAVSWIAEPSLKIDGVPLPLPTTIVHNDGVVGGGSIPAEKLIGLADGEHTASVDVELKIFDIPKWKLPASNDLSGKTPDFTVHLQKQATFVILPATQPSVELVNDPLVLRPSVEPYCYRWAGDSPDLVRVKLTLRANQTAGVYRAAFRCGAKEFPIDVPIFVSANFVSQASLDLNCPGVDREKLELVLRPDPRRAAETSNLLKIDGREVVVPVRLTTDEVPTTMPGRTPIANPPTTTPR